MFEKRSLQTGFPKRSPEEYIDSLKALTKTTAAEDAAILMALSEASTVLNIDINEINKAASLVVDRIQARYINGQT